MHSIKYFLKTLTITASSVLSACGGYTNPGTGTQSIEVVAELAYALNKDETAVQIEITDGSTRIQGATVTLTDAATSEVFQVGEHRHGYQGALPGYHRRLMLVVKTDSDGLSARIEGPGSFVMNAPVHNGIIRRSQTDSMRVGWDTIDGLRADGVEIHIDDFNRTMSDRGVVDIPLLDISSRAQELRVRRFNEIQLDGGKGASVMRMYYGVKSTVLVTD